MTKILEFPKPCLLSLERDCFVSLTPRNDKLRNSRIPKKKPPNPQKNKGILEFLVIKSRISKKKP